MMKMKKIFVIVVCGLIVANLVAQERDSTRNKWTNEFGFHAGSTTGIGLSYRYWPKKLGVQFTILPVKSPDETFVSVGLTALYSIYNSRHIHFYGYLGNTVLVNNYKRYYYFTDDDSYERVHSTKYNIGFGPGFGVGTRVRFNIMLGYGFYDVTDEFNIYPAGEMGLYFRF